MARASNDMSQLSDMVSPAFDVVFLRPSYGHYYFGDYYGANYPHRILPVVFVPFQPLGLRSVLRAHAGIIETTASGITACKPISPTGATTKRLGHRAPGRPSEHSWRGETIPTSRVS